MVDALWEVWRVLRDEGELVDVRPQSHSGPIVLLDGPQRTEVGEMDASGTLVDDRAADRAIQTMLDQGAFQPVHRARFPFEFSWTNVDDLAAFMEGSRRVEEIRPSCDELREIHRERSTQAGRDLRIGFHRPMILATYRKEPRRGDRKDRAGSAAAAGLGGVLGL